MKKRFFTLITLLSLVLGIQAYNTEKQVLHDNILSNITGAAVNDSQTMLSITKLGAKGDGKSDCLPAFRKAMKKAQKTKGGLHIVVPQGDYYLRGPIHLVSNVTLELQEGARLMFSPNPDDYLPVVKTSWEGSFCYNHSPMIYGYGLSNVAIIGKGSIDGNCAETFPLWRKEQKKDQMLSREYNHNGVKHEERMFGKGHLLRPQLLQLFDCKNITLEGVFITNSPFWCVHLLCCENVICRGLRYDAKLVNNDGIDPEMTRNLLIENIEFNNGDDNVAIKAGRDNDGWSGMPSENIIIRNCRFKGLHGLVIGSEMSAGVRNVFVEDCTVAGYCKRALYVKSNPNRGGFVHDIYFKNCHFDEVEDMFYITSMYAGEGQDDNHFTDIHDIHVENVSARKVNNAAIVLQGTEALPIYNVSFTDFNVEEAKVGFSSMHTKDVILRNCNIGGRVDGAPSQAAHKDAVFDRDKRYLPNPLKWEKKSGEAKNLKQWEERRKEIASLIQEHEIGVIPEVSKDQIKARMDGDTLFVTVTVGKESLTLKSVIRYPETGKAPYPIMIGSSRISLPDSLLRARPIALMNYNERQVNGYSQFRGDTCRTNYGFVRLYPHLIDNGAYSMWAWGFQRIIDGLEILGPEVTKIDTKHIGVTGCSYAGKMALFCGAFDPRVTLTIAQEPGGGGAAAWRVSQTLEEVEDLDRTDYHWFKESLREKFHDDNVFDLPYDHHELCALLCPRAFLMLGNTDYKWLADESGYVSVNAARKVWERFNIADRMGYSILGNHPHCQLPAEQYPEVEAFIDRYLLGKNVSTANIRIAPMFEGKVSLSDWINF